MMPSPRVADRPEAALDVAEQYLRRERPLSALVALLVVSVFVGTFLVTSLLPAVAVGAVLLAVVRAPLVRPRGSVRLRTDADVDTVVESFAGPTPPVLVFQWGIAEEITPGDGPVTYRVSYLFGLRSVDVTVRTRTTDRADGRRVSLEVTADGHPWATYTVDVSRADGHTVVDYEYRADRRFGLRRLPQRVIAARYRDEALRVQGYRVVEREAEYVR